MTKRIMNDYKEIEKEIIKNSIFPIIKIIYDKSNSLTCKIILRGPSETPYENGLFVLDVKFSSEYPFTSPSIYFGTPILHPNVANNGRICIDILQNKWSSAFSLLSVILSISSLLGDPNTKEPLNIEINDLYLKDLSAFNVTVREHVSKNTYKL